jgi:hypothetical protein
VNAGEGDQRCQAGPLVHLLSDCRGSRDAVRIVDRHGDAVTACISHGAQLLHAMTDARVEFGPGGVPGDAIACYRAAFPHRGCRAGDEAALAVLSRDDYLYQAGHHDAYTQASIAGELMPEAAYRRGLQDGRTQRIDERLLAGLPPEGWPQLHDPADELAQRGDRP